MELDLQPVLQNELVFLRPLQEDDFEALFQIARDPLLWEQHQIKDRYTKQKFTIFFNEAIDSKGAFAIFDSKTETFIGSSRFKIIDAKNSIVEIGWSFLSRSYWGGQYNRAFKKLMINYALESCRCVIFYVNPTNYRSQKALEKLGAKKMTYPKEPWVLKENIGVTYAIDSALKD